MWLSTDWCRLFRWLFSRGVDVNLSPSNVGSILHRRYRHPGSSKFGRFGTDRFGFRRFRCPIRFSGSWGTTGTDNTESTSSEMTD